MNFIEQLKGKSILITGACGLIGLATVEYFMFLNENHDYQINITAMCRDRVVAHNKFKKYNQSKYLDILEQDVCTPLDPAKSWNYIIHAASNAHPIAFSKEPVETMKANIIGTINILDYIVNKKNKEDCELVYISSGEVYGEAECDKEGFHENQIGIVNQLNARACYPESKRAAETLCISYVNEYNIKAKIARLGYVYGPGFSDKNTRADVQFFRNAINKENIVLKSKGTQLRSYCYISDAISGIIYVLLKGDNAGVYNIANKNCVLSIRQFAEMIAKECNVKVEFNIPDSIETKGYSKMKQEILCVDKLEALGWKALVNIEDGIKLVVNVK